MHKMRIIYLLAMVFVLNKSEAQVYKYSNEFLSLGVGARAYGMVGAVISSVNDVTAVYWNHAWLF